MRKDKSIPVYKDPVCGMLLNHLTAAFKSHHEGKAYYFCAGVCRDAFVSDPERFLSHRHRWCQGVRSRPHQHQQHGVAGSRHG